MIMTISIIFAIINFICLNYIISKIFHNHVHSLKWILIPISTYLTYIVLSVFCSSYFLEVVLAFLYYIIPIINTYCVAKCYAISFSNAFRTYLFIAFTNMIASSLIINLLGATGNNVYLIEFIMSLLSLVLVLLLGRSKTSFKIQTTTQWLSSRIKNFLIIILGVCVLCLSLIFEKEYYYEYFDKWVVFISVLVAVFTILTALAFPIMIISHISNTHLKNLNEQYIKQLDAQINYYQALSQYNYEIRRFKHDYKNTSMALLDLLRNNNAKAAVELLETASENIKAITLDFIPFDTGNDIADALLKEKQLCAKSLNTEIAFSGALPKDAITSHDMCIILGNALDNAIEACRREPRNINKRVSVEAICRNGFIFIKIQNPVFENVHIKNNAIATTKLDKNLHGFGISSIRKVVEKYNGLVKLNCENQVFTIEIELELTI